VYRQRQAQFEILKKSYNQILKSSALIGSSSVISIGFGVLRNKAMALMLGPAGVGMLGLYGSILDVTRSVAGMGINTSGVREIAEAVGSQDSLRIARMVTTLRRIAMYLGALGALLLLVFSKSVSRVTFGDEKHTGAVALLALAVFLTDVSAGQAALVQGMRRIGDLARMAVLGAMYGTIFSIPIVYFYREQGMVPSLVCVAAMSILTSWWYARKIQVEKVRLSLGQVFSEASGLLKLGVVFMASGLMAMGGSYVIRIILVKQLDMAAAGYYQAAWTLGGLYTGFVLQAMGADFYPRLVASVRNHDECNRLVNEQAEIGLLLGGPGVVGTLTFAPVVIAVFYSQKFGPTVEILRWICLGMLLRVSSWPLGFIILARGERGIFFWTDLLCNSLNLALVWVGVKQWGLAGAGIAFCGANVFNLACNYVLARRLCGFRWSAATRKMALVFLPLVTALFVSWYFLPRWMVVAGGSLLTVMLSVYSLRTLCALIRFEKLPGPVRKLLVLLRLRPAAADEEVVAVLPGPPTGAFADNLTQETNI
jgi:antigen flippase